MWPAFLQVHPRAALSLANYTQKLWELIDLEGKDLTLRWFLGGHFHTESQNHRMVGVGRDLCGSSSPTLKVSVHMAKHHSVFDGLQKRFPTVWIFQGPPVLANNIFINKTLFFGIMSSTSTFPPLSYRVIFHLLFFLPNWRYFHGFSNAVSWLTSITVAAVDAVQAFGNIKASSG